MSTKTCRCWKELNKQGAFRSIIRVASSDKNTLRKYTNLAFWIESKLQQIPLNGDVNSSLFNRKGYGIMSERYWKQVERLRLAWNVNHQGSLMPSIDDPRI